MSLLWPRILHVEHFYELLRTCTLLLIFTGLLFFSFSFLCDSFIFVLLLAFSTGGTPLESVKCRVTATSDNMVEAYNNICRESGFWGLWSGTPSRTLEGALLGAFFMLGSTRKFLLYLMDECSGKEEALTSHQNVYISMCVCISFHYIQ